jgi:hypothetical protein
LPETVRPVVFTLRPLPRLSAGRALRVVSGRDETPPCRPAAG